MGIVNGTTNFILTKMSQEGMEFSDALALATELDMQRQILPQISKELMQEERLPSLHQLPLIPELPLTMFI